MGFGIVLVWGGLQILGSDPLERAWDATERMKPLIAVIDRYKSEHGTYPESLDGMEPSSDVLPDPEDGLGWDYSRLPGQDEFCLVITTPIQGSSCCEHLLFTSDRRVWRFGD